MGRHSAPSSPRTAAPHEALGQRLFRRRGNHTRRLRAVRGRRRAAARAFSAAPARAATMTPAPAATPQRCYLQSARALPRVRTALTANRGRSGPARRRAQLRCRASSQEEDGFSGPVAEMFDGLYNRAGYRIKYGVFKEKVEPEGENGCGKMTFAEYMDASSDERAAAQAQAAKDLVNIDKDERARRDKVGTVLLSGTGVAMLAFWLLGAPASTRALLSLPLFFGVGFFVSGKMGL
mmetsp:Transcript_20359/g.51253  ORF Transcript_20359/g.51253 Transcript_20359/m.51253 type:complete len:236 (-) Transcript_20359:319-1026(-)